MICSARHQTLLFSSFLIALTAITSAAQTRTLTADDYARAEQFMGYNTNRLVLRSAVNPTWLPDDRIWYRIATDNGNEFILVDPGRAARSSAFDHRRIADALSAASGTKYEPFRLPFNTFNFEDSGRSITFSAGNRRW